MKKIQLPFTQYPGNKWLAGQVEKAGSDSTVPFIHGVVRGTLANPADVDAGDALEAVLEDADLEDFSQDEFDRLSIAFLLLFNDSARSLLSARPFPSAVWSEFRTDAGALFALNDAADLVSGFVKGFYLKNVSKKEQLPRTYACLSRLQDEGDWCRMMYESPDLLEKTFPHGGFPADVISETAQWVEEYTVRVALQAKEEVKGKGKSAEG